MQEANSTQVSEFILIGFSDRLEVQISLFLFFLLIYLLTLIGNLAMIILIQTDSLRHSPMYFFLTNLSFIDMFFSSSITPRFLYDLLIGRKVISYNACATQMWFASTFSTVESYLLAAMAYDRFVAICNPLLYPVTMTRNTCLHLLAACYMAGTVTSMAHTSATFGLNFCGPNEVESYFCDIPPLQRLSCSDNYVSKTVLFVFSAFVVVLNAIIVLISYAYIISTILRMRSSTSRHKAFSTCASHLVLIVMYYGTLIFMYVQPGDKDKIASVFYTTVIPMLNPAIYSLRNEEVKKALKKKMNKNIFLQQPK